MKHNDITDVNKFEKIPQEVLENLFNVFLDEQNEYYYNIMRTINIEGLDNLDAQYFDTYVFKEEDSWTVISFRFYGTTRLWWMVCKANNIFNPFNKPEAGTKLVILKPEVVQNIVINRLRVG